MHDEVKPVVLKYLEDRRLTGKSLPATELLTKLGIPDARNVNSEYAWRRKGDPEVICTVWAEFINVDSLGRWYTRESLEAETMRGGGERSPIQKRRGHERINLLRSAANSGKAVIAFLQINQKSIQELERNESAATSVRVKDDEVWHVVEWNETKKEAWLVRGATRWIPTVSQPNFEGDEAPPDSPGAGGNSSSEPENESNFGFPDYETRKKVEIAAVAFVTKHYEGKGCHVTSKETSNLAGCGNTSPRRHLKGQFKRC